jgi:putative photosynthetic complex assembly protein 2
MVAVLFLLSWQQPNQTALWTFTVLWLMRWSSKLNLVLGVRNYNQSWLPEHLAYVHSYIPRRVLNPLFPVSVVVGGVVTFLLFNAAMQTPELGLMIGLTLAGAIAALGTLEHLFLMAPLRDAALWDWAAPDRGPAVTKSEPQS